MFNPEYLTISLFSLSLLVEIKLNEKKQKLMVSLRFLNWIHFLSLVLFWDDKLWKVRLIFLPFL